MSAPSEADANNVIEGAATPTSSTPAPTQAQAPSALLQVVSGTPAAVSDRPAAEASTTSPRITTPTSDDDNDDQPSATNPSNQQLDIAAQELYDGHILMSGYLYKKGEHRRSWKRRWFVLRPRHLTYYKDTREYIPLNVIAVSDITTITPLDHPKHENLFCLVTRHRTFLVKPTGSGDGTSEDDHGEANGDGGKRDMMKWIESIQTAMLMNQEHVAESSGASAGVVGAGNALVQRRMASESDALPPHPTMTSLHHAHTTHRSISTHEQTAASSARALESGARNGMHDTSRYVGATRSFTTPAMMHTMSVSPSKSLNAPSIQPVSVSKVPSLNNMISSVPPISTTSSPTVLPQNIVKSPTSPTAGGTGGIDANGYMFPMLPAGQISVHQHVLPESMMTTVVTGTVSPRSSVHDPSQPTPQHQNLVRKATNRSITHDNADRGSMKESVATTESVLTSGSVSFSMTGHGLGIGSGVSSVGEADVPDAGAMGLVGMAIRDQPMPITSSLVTPNGVPQQQEDDHHGSGTPTQTRRDTGAPRPIENAVKGGEPEPTTQDPATDATTPSREAQPLEHGSVVHQTSLGEAGDAGGSQQVLSDSEDDEYRSGISAHMQAIQANGGNTGRQEMTAQTRDVLMEAPVDHLTPSQRDQLQSAVATLMNDQVIYQGYLDRLSGRLGKTWKKRWFVLRNGRLTCYKNESEYEVMSIVPVDEILDVVDIEPMGKKVHVHCFKVVLAKHSWIMSAESEEVAMQWINAFRYMKQVIARQGGIATLS